MGILDELGSLANQFAGGRVSDAEIHETYDRAAREVPHGTLSEGLSEAFRSDQTPPFEQMVGGLYRQSNPDQKAGLLNQILASLGSGGAAQALTAGGLGGALAGMLRGGTVTPEQAERIPPQQVEVLAQEAAKKDPSIIDRASSFYAQHPTLVKALGAGALALLMSHISRARR